MLLLLLLLYALLQHQSDLIYPTWDQAYNLTLTVYHACKHMTVHTCSRLLPPGLRLDWLEQQQYDLRADLALSTAGEHHDALVDSTRGGYPLEHWLWLHLVGSS